MTAPRPHPTGRIRVHRRFVAEDAQRRSWGRLPSGRSVEVGGSPEAVRVWSPDGELEVELHFGPDGVTLRGRALRLEVAGDSITLTADRLRLDGREVAITARDHLTLSSAGALGVEAAADVVVVGAHVRLN